MTGFVEGFQGDELRGYVASEASTCAISVADAEGNAIAHGIAKRIRSENYNFSFALTTGLPETSSVRVFANSIELAGSPIALGQGVFDGKIEVYDGKISGWMQERSVEAPARTIKIYDQYGRLLHSEVVKKRNTLFPNHFSFDAPRSLLGFLEIGIWAECKGVIFAKTTASFPVDGYLDTLQPGRVAGWAMVPGDPSLKINLAVKIDGKTVASAICQQLRGDLKAKYPNASDDVLRCGFDIGIPDWDSDPVHAHAFSLCVAESGVEIFSGPHAVADVPWSVQTVRKASEIIAESSLSEIERSLVRHHLANVVSQFRTGTALVYKMTADRVPFAPRLSIIIPVYRDVEVTVACINSVLAHRCEKTDTVIVINDRSPDSDMSEILEANFGKTPNLWLLTNHTNRGFVGTVNRGLSMARLGDVILLNSDTVFFEGGIDDLAAYARMSKAVGTITPLSNNATIFSYPHSTLPTGDLEEIAWEEVASVIRRQPKQLVDVPTGHGFCLYIKRDVLDAIGYLDEIFGRGYGEENDFCQKSADLGYRNVAATTVFVQHRESVSFGTDKDGLRAKNLAVLGSRYPEYQAFIDRWQSLDPLRSARWSVDRKRLRHASETGTSFVLSIDNDMIGGTIQARNDIENNVGFGDRVILRCRAVGKTIQLSYDSEDMLSVYQLSDTRDVFETLACANITLCVVHQLLGFDEAFIAGLTKMLGSVPGVFFVHDFYSICQRITMLDAVDRFCDGAFNRCTPCIAVGGAHERSVLGLAPVAHRELFGRFLRACRHVVAPSKDTAARMEKAFEGLKVEAIPHPETVVEAKLSKKKRNRNAVVALGAIGPHKGSRQLLELASIAAMDAPDLRFHIVGYTDIDEQFKALNNVFIHGRYDQDSLPRILGEVNAASAIFLHQWPETYSYTLSEVIRYGMVPIVSDLGAPAERVNELCVGSLITYPLTPSDVLLQLQKMQIIGDWAEPHFRLFAAAHSSVVHLHPIIENRMEKK